MRLVVTVYIGIVLVAYAIVVIIYMLVIKKNAKDVEKLIAKKKNVINTEAEVKPEAEAEAEAE